MTEPKDFSSTPSTQNDQNKSFSKLADQEQEQINELITKLQAFTFKGSEIASLIDSVMSTDLKKQHSGLVGLKKFLSQPQGSPIEEVLDSGVVPRLLEIMEDSIEPQIQLDAAWCLVTLCSGTPEQTQQVVDCGMIPIFLSALDSAGFKVTQQILWGLGKIAESSAAFRDLIIKEGGVEIIVNVVEDALTLGSKRNGAWALSNLCKGKPAPPFGSISGALPAFCNLLKNENHQEILTYAAWGLFYSSGRKEGIEMILQSDVISAIVGFLSSPILSIVTPCLKIVGNIIAGTDKQTSMVLKEKDFLPGLLNLTSHESKAIRKEAFWIASNLTSGTPAQVESIMGNPAFVERIIDAAKNDADEIRREAVYALTNSTRAGTSAQIKRLLTYGVFQCLIEVLGEVEDAKILLEVLDSIEDCIKWGKVLNLVDEKGQSKFLLEFENHGGSAKIEQLQKHPNKEVHKRACVIIETYLDNFFQ